MPQNMVVIGASAGGLESIKALVGGLPADFAAAVLVVLHIPPGYTSTLPQILSLAGPLPAHQPYDGEKLQPGHIYVAKPDHHLLVEGDSVGVKKSPKENRFRPSIDVLFRSAAYHHGPQVAGVILSGALDDGTSGSWTIKHLGGTVIVQNPDEAAFDSMPLSALDQVQVDHTLFAAEMGPFLNRWVSKLTPKRSVSMADSKRIETEINIASGQDAFKKGVMEIGKLSPYACPECHGVLLQIEEGLNSRFRCHTGHAYTPQALLSGLIENIDEGFWQVSRALDEAVMLLQHIAERFMDANQPELAAPFLEKASITRERAQALHELTMRVEDIDSESLRKQGKETEG